MTAIRAGLDNTCSRVTQVTLKSQSQPAPGLRSKARSIKGQSDPEFPNVSSVPTMARSI